MQPYVDYTLLRPDAKTADFLKLCDTAVKPENRNIVRSVCVLPDKEIIELCRRAFSAAAKHTPELRTKVCVVNDFPLGRGTLHMKLEGARMARRWGADEIDTVIDARLLLEKNYRQLSEELAAVADVFPGATKVILETGHPWYDEELIKEATLLVEKSGAFCAKTSTGFVANIPVEQKVQHVKWMHEAAPRLMIKVAGGIKTMAHAKLFWDVVPREKLIFGASERFWEVQG